MQISEKDFEDWVCNNLDAVTGQTGSRLLGRQVRLPTGGIADVIACSPIESSTDGATSLAVIELKRDRAEVSALTQVLGYMGVLEDCVFHAQVRARRDGLAMPWVQVQGIIAAPSASTELGWCLAGMQCAIVKFVELRVTVAAYRHGNTINGRALHQPADALSRAAELLCNQLAPYAIVGANIPSEVDGADSHDQA